MLSCDFEESCFGTTKVWCPIHEDSSCTIECTKDGACESVYLYVESEYDGVRTVVDGEENVIFECDSETEAFCSVYYTSDALVICNDGEDCQKICSDDERVFQMLDATAALSLNLTCDGSGWSSCQYSTILCPTAHNATCIISCNGAFSCGSTVILVENANANYNSLQINCLQSDSDCYDMVVTVQTAEIKNIDINCNGTYADCNRMVLTVDADLVGDIVIHCTSVGGCEDSSWSANVENFERAQLMCSGRLSCRSSLIGFSDAKSMTLDCNHGVSASSFSLNDFTPLIKRQLETTASGFFV